MSNRIERTNVRYHEKEHKALFNKVRTMIRRIKTLPKVDKKALLLDLVYANGDLMHFLSICKQFPNVEDYFNSIKAYLDLEEASYDYKGLRLMYMPGKMAQLMDIIRLHHNKAERIETLRDKIFNR